MWKRQLWEAKQKLTALKAKDEAYQQHIRELHNYNEIKDTCQTLMGKLAELEGCVTKEMYPRYDLELED